MVHYLILVQRQIFERRSHKFWKFPSQRPGGKGGWDRLLMDKMSFPDNLTFFSKFGNFCYTFRKDKLKQGLKQEIPTHQSPKILSETSNTLKSLYAAKDRLLVGSSSAVYSMKCKTCYEEYVGETFCAVWVCHNEHSIAVRLGQCSNLTIACPQPVIYAWNGLVEFVCDKFTI